MIPTWSEILTRIPRFEHSDWQAMSLAKRWFVATRSAVFVMTLFSAGIGLLMAVGSATFDSINAVLVCFGLVLAHATNNLLNDWTDFKKGIDKDNYFRTQYGPQTIEAGFLSETKLLTYTAITGLAAIACGLALVIRTDVTTLYFMLAGSFFVLFYTWPLKYIGLGEPSVWLVWGPLMVVGSAYVVSGQLDMSVVWLSCLYGLGPTTVLFAKHTDKLEEDKKKGVHTLPVILGQALSRNFTLLLWFLQLVGILIAVVLGYLGIHFLLVLFAIPKLVNVIPAFRVARPETEPDDMPPGVWPLYLVSYAFTYNKAFSGLLFLAVLVQVAILLLGYS